MASLNLRVAPPRPFTQNETHDSLTQHRFLFNNFYRKDKDFKPLLKTNFRWDPNSVHYGVTENEYDELETLLGNICSLLPFPYSGTSVKIPIVKIRFTPKLANYLLFWPCTQSCTSPRRSPWVKFSPKSQFSVTTSKFDERLAYWPKNQLPFIDKFIGKLC